MTRGQDSLAIDHYDVSDRSQTEEGVAMAAKVWSLPVLAPSDEEMQAHEKYLSDLDKAVKGSCLWRSLSAPTSQ